MSFLTPFALAFFALSVPLVLLYFLKVRRRERTVSSLLLWHTSVRDREASTFFQRLHRDPLMLLQLLALLALALALARPVATVMGQGARKVVVVLDTSASMKARDVSPSRFEVARSGAASLVRGLGEGAEVMVIEAPDLLRGASDPLATRSLVGPLEGRAGDGTRPDPRVLSLLLLCSRRRKRGGTWHRTIVRRIRHIEAVR